MILAAIDWLSISINILLLIFVIVSFLMILVILMQRPKQEGLGAAFGGGVTDQVFGARTTGVLQKGTIFLASMFFILSLALAVLIGMQNRDVTLVTAEIPEAATTEEAPVSEPVTPQTPASLADGLPPEPQPTEEVPPAEETPAPAEETPVPVEGTPPLETEPTPEEVENAPEETEAAPEETPADDGDESPAEEPAEEP
jgi:preprotein translocase subunit SecG